MDAAYTGNRISSRRKELGMTQKDLAEKIHVTDKAVSKWERGINFPDLGLMEDLARALDTTPAALLGLEEASRDEIVRNVTELSGEQLEESKKDIHFFGWGCLLAAALLICAYQLFGGKDVVRIQRAYQILHCVILAVAIGGLYLLVKYGQIRKFGVAELFISYGALGAIAVHMGYHFLTGYSIHPIVGAVLIGVTACLVQWLFYRIMVPFFAKALPLICTTGFALWRIPQTYPFRPDILIFALPAICCLVVWCICLFISIRKGTEKPVLTKKSIVMVLALAVLTTFLFYTPLVRTYLHIRHNHLEEYAQSLLAQCDNAVSTSYGLWKVSVHPEEGMVEFHTGGSGLVPNSTYEGFYYSADDTHIPFLRLNVSMEVSGDTAHWNDGTDNHGASVRIRPCWFWFEASF